MPSGGMPGSPTTLAGRRRGATPQILYLPCFHRFALSRFIPPPPTPVTASEGGAGSLTPLDPKRPLSSYVPTF